MKLMRLVFLLALGASALLAYLVRQRSVEEGESYARALRAIVNDMAGCTTQACSEVRQAVQDGRLAARRREAAVERDMAAAESG